MLHVDFYWDVGSPYTYLATTQIDGLRRRTGAEITFVPFLLGGVFKATGNDSPLKNPAKAAYLFVDLGRWRDEYGVPMKLPGEVTFPINTLSSMRAAVAADRAGQGEVFAQALFKTFWVDGRDVSTPEVLADVAASVGLDGPGLLAAAASPEVKDKLRHDTERAVERGAFGAPAFFFGEQLYWGNDRLGHLERALLAAR